MAASPLDATQWDDSIPVSDDVYHHVNARWLAANPVPPDYSMWGACIQLDPLGQSPAALTAPDADATPARGS